MTKAKTRQYRVKIAEGKTYIFHLSDILKHWLWWHRLANTALGVSSEDERLAWPVYFEMQKKKR